MISVAKAKYVRISPRKVRYVIDLIRKKSVAQAQAILSGSPRRAGEIMRKLLLQAVDAAEKNSKIPSQDLFVSKVMADGGPSMRRFRAASMGRGMTIKKRTSHIYLELDLVKKAAGVRSEKTAAQKTIKTTHSEPRMKKAPAKRSQKKMAGAK